MESNEQAKGKSPKEVFADSKRKLSANQGYQHLTIQLHAIQQIRATEGGTPDGYHKIGQLKQMLHGIIDRF